MNSFIRFRSLGEDFTEENLKKVIAGEKESPERNEKVPDRKEAKPEKRKFDLVVDIQEKMAQGKNGGYVQWAKKYNVKQFAKSILFLQQHDIHDKEMLDALVDGSSVKYHELMAKNVNYFSSIIGFIIGDKLGKKRAGIEVEIGI